MNFLKKASLNIKRINTTSLHLTNTNSIFFTQYKFFSLFVRRFKDNSYLSRGELEEVCLGGKFYNLILNSKSK